MQLGTVEVQGLPRVVGRIGSDQVVDIARTSELNRLGPRRFPIDMVDLLEAGHLGAELVKIVEDLAHQRPDECCLFKLAAVTLRAPVPRPPKVVCVFANKKDVPVEQYQPEHGGRWPRPQFFLKGSNSVIGHEEPIIITHGMGVIQPEGELCAVIGRRARNLTREDALTAVAGFCLANDLSCSTFGLQDGTVLHIPRRNGDPEVMITRPMARAKSVDTFCPTGPWLVPTAEVGDLGSIMVRTRVNENVIQEGLIGDQRYDIADILATITQWMTLEPGDILPLGATNGAPNWPLRAANLHEYDGGSISVEATRVGLLSNPIRVVPAAREVEPAVPGGR